MSMIDNFSPLNCKAERPTIETDLKRDQLLLKAPYPLS